MSNKTNKRRKSFDKEPISAIKSDFSARFDSLQDITDSEVLEIKKKYNPYTY